MADDGSCCGSSARPSVNRTQSTRVWWRIGVAAVLSGQSMVFGLGINLAPPKYGTTVYWSLHGALFLSAVVVLLLLGPRLWRATAASLREGRVTVEGLFVVSCLGALVASMVSSITGVGAVYYEVVAVVLAIYTVGKLVGERSKDKVIEEMGRFRRSFDLAVKIAANGSRKIIDVADLQPGERVEVAPGAGIPVDGKITEGISFVEEAFLTGEPAPVPRGPGDIVYAGTHAVDGRLVIEVVAAEGRRLDQILTSVEVSRFQPSRLQEDADRAIQWFLPFVIAVAVATFLGWWLSGAVDWSRALFFSMAVLLVACPCALGLATPIAVWKGLFQLASRGLLARHGGVLDALSRTSHIFFDKTGTLSESRMAVASFEVEQDFANKENQLRRWVALLERGVPHPVARGLEVVAGLETQDNFNEKIAQTRTVAGEGIEGVIQDEQGREHHLRIGTAEFAGPPDCKGADVWVQVDGLAAARIKMEERWRLEAERALSELIELGCQVTILSGDTAGSDKRIGNFSVEGCLSPEEKRTRLQGAVLAGQEPVYVGDGLNDLPAMMEGICALAMEEGADLTKSGADGLLLGGRLRVLPVAVKMARRIRRGVRTNFAFALFYNLIGITLAAGGILHPVVAALLMLCSSAIVSIRALQSAE